MAHAHRMRHHVAEQWQVRAADRRGRAAARRWRHSGSEPRWAASDLAARRMLSLIFAPAFVLGAAGAAVLAALAAPNADPGTAFYTAVAAVCALFAVVALVDLWVIRRRMAEQRRWHH
ncbi:hypothetical protein [Kitasatospora sp. NPDC059571]|uniref:hypothetical protein n=1 Tax=Kitasatospora sp. NPDC059571 TaxID=3346871 RepID=UPI00368925F3